MGRRSGKGKNDNSRRRRRQKDPSTCHQLESSNRGKQDVDDDHHHADDEDSARRRRPIDTTDTCHEGAAPGNFHREAGPGCHIARHPDDDQEDGASSLSAWVLEWESIDPSDYDEDEVPDLAVDEEEGILTLCNIHDYYVVAYITIYETPLRGRSGRLLSQGSTTDDDGKTQACSTLIVLCPPRKFAHLCTIDDEQIRNDPGLLNLDSDVQEWRRHPCPDVAHAHGLGFPLSAGDGPVLCTQGVGGQLTHFFSGNLHAIDFRCAIGTPLLAAVDGVVVEAAVEHERLTGIAVSNLFRWNSILIQMDRGGDGDGDGGGGGAPRDANQPSDDDAPLFVEYVHVASSLVRKGDHVVRGQVIGTSGSVGFSPEPHLHFAAYRSPDAAAHTVRVCFESSSNPGQTFLPRAGCWYNAAGLVGKSEGPCTELTVNPVNNHL